MPPVRIHVTQLGRGFVAQCSEPVVTAMGGSAAEAAENARALAKHIIETFSFQQRPTTLIVRIDQEGRHVMAMQSIDAPFSVSAVGKENVRYYLECGN